MTDTADRADVLLVLAERCEAATGPDRDIDGWIWAHLKAGDPYIIGTEEGRFPRKPIYGERADVMRKMSGKDAADYICAPLFTASFDATMTLVPDEHSWTVGDCGEDDKPWACVTEWAESARDFASSVAATPTLALCAAALRALATPTETTDAG